MCANTASKWLRRQSFPSFWKCPRFYRQHQFWTGQPPVSSHQSHLWPPATTPAACTSIQPPPLASKSMSGHSLKYILLPLYYNQGSCGFSEKT